MAATAPAGLFLASGEPDDEIDGGRRLRLATMAAAAAATAAAVAWCRGDMDLCRGELCGL